MYCYYFIVARYDLSPEDDIWLGAWWVGFVFSGVCTLLLACCVLQIPPTIGVTEDTSVPRQHSEEVLATGATAFQHLGGFRDASARLLKNKTFLALSVAETLEGFVVVGLAAFMPKIVETQFNLSAGLSAMFVGDSIYNLYILWN